MSWTPARLQMGHPCPVTASSSLFTLQTGFPNILSPHPLTFQSRIQWVDLGVEVIVGGKGLDAVAYPPSLPRRSCATSSSGCRMRRHGGRRLSCRSWRGWRLASLGMARAVLPSPQAAPAHQGAPTIPRGCAAWPQVAGEWGLGQGRAPP